MNEKDKSFVIRAFVCTLLACSMSVVIALLMGLWEEKIDNDKIFAILQPLAQQVNGAVISILSALLAVKYTKGDKDE